MSFCLSSIASLTFNDIYSALLPYRELLLANAVMLSEIPAPTFAERQRLQFLLNRFQESGLDSSCFDDAGNALAVLPGTAEEQQGYLLVFAHADTPFATAVPHAVTVQQSRIQGPSISDNALGLAAVATLPLLLQKLNIELKHPLLLMGTVQSLGRGDLAGIRHFLQHNRLPINAALCLEGSFLDRLSYESIGMLRGEIICEANTENVHDSSTAMVIMAQLITQIDAISKDAGPAGQLILGAVHGGTAYNTAAHSVRLQFEVRSRDRNVVAAIYDKITAAVQQLNRDPATTTSLEMIARREPGGLAADHPLVQAAHAVQQQLEIQALVTPSSGELSALLARKIPSLTLGLTRGGRRHQPSEYIEIDPVFTGLTQLVGLLQVIDQGL